MELSNFNKLMTNTTDGNFISINDVNFSFHVVTRNQTMRLDSISYLLYGDVKYVTELAYINGLTNVFSIKEDDILLVVNEEDITRVFDFSAGLINSMVEAIMSANTGKKSAPDSNRAQSKSNRKQSELDKKIPPNILNNEKMVVQDGKLILRTNF